MAKCDIQIELEEESLSYRPGDVIRGQVRVEVHQACRCEGLEVACEWSTRGRGYIDAAGQTLELFEGDWEAGEAHAYPFELTIPTGPFSYDGHDLSVEWRIRAEADLPFARDPSAEVAFSLEPIELSDPDEYIFGSSFAYEAAERKSSEVEAAGVMGCALLVGLLCLIGGIGMLVWGLYATDTATYWTNILFGVFLLAISGLAAYFGIRAMLVKGYIDDVAINPVPDQAAGGERIGVNIELTPASPFELNELRATLRGLERTLRPDGEHDNASTHTIYEETKLVSGSVDRTVEDPLTVSTHFTLPADAPCSFYAPSNQVLWRIEVHADIADLPDWTGSEYIRVTPARAPVTLADPEISTDEKSDEQPAVAAAHQAS